MQTATMTAPTKYASILATSKRIRWDITNDVLRGRGFDRTNHYLPDGLTRVSQMGLSEAEQRLLSQIQGRTYANMFGLVERFINAKVLELSQDYWLADQAALEALVGFSSEELKHQELFRQVEQLIADTMPAGYRFLPQPDAVGRVVLGKSTWAVLLLTLHIELFVLEHYRESIEPATNLSPLFKDILKFHWKEESQHALMDEIELRRHDATVTPAERDAAVDDFIALVVAVDGILQVQADEDVRYFGQICGRELADTERARLQAGVLQAYRWQYIFSGAQQPHFLAVLGSLITEAQAARIMAALATLQ